MKPIQTFTVAPALPERLKHLPELAYNLRWAWDYDSRSLFRRLDRHLWETSGHNPVLMLGLIDQRKLEAAVEDPGFVAHYERVRAALDGYLSDPGTWYHRETGGRNHLCVAYFSAEFAIAECLPIYSGGLGVLAGDHLKSASDLGLPLISVGLLYQQGYFRQYLNADGWQQEARAEQDFHTLPVRPVLKDGQPLTIRVPLGTKEISARVWLAQVGRVPLYLLDANVPDNRPEEREITVQLYGGERDLRIRQEILLGIGGIRALEALGIEPEVCHLNEGHTAFVALERIRRLMQRESLNFAEARYATRAGHVFTTHTPVPAGNDYFSPALMEHYFHSYWPQLGLDRDGFLALGRRNPGDSFEEFCMTVLALNLSNHNNAVSRLHESVSRDMWAGLWPEAPRAELPISHVTNGVHAESWISHDLTHLLDNYLGPAWRSRTGDADAWDGMEHIPIEELWRTHERRRERLVAFARGRLRQQLAQRGASLFEQSGADSILDPQALTIGFARRFATYKRPLLLLSDTERLARLLNDPERPVQIIFAGKAHPRDEAGKDMIRQIAHLSRQPPFHKSVVFLEDYDLDVARYMVQGVDVWLNNPRRPLEASGTSGMKAALNGVLNLSILDGWWDEAYEPEIGWAIGKGEQYEDEVTQDNIESAALYDLLEKEIVPLFYERKGDRLPHYWVQRMRKAMRELCPRFNTCRMVSEYARRFYLPAHRHYQRLTATGFAPARQLADWSNRVTRHWKDVHIEAVQAGGSPDLRVGDPFSVGARVRLGALTPEDVSVQLCLGTVNSQGELVNPALIAMNAELQDGSAWNYRTSSQPCCHSGLYGYTVRILPRHSDLHNPWALGLAHWATP